MKLAKKDIFENREKESLIDKVFYFLKIATPLFIFIALLFVLVKILKTYSYQDVVRDIKNTPQSSICFALFFVFLNYFTLTLYDKISFAYVNQKLEYPRIALTSFLSYAFSQNIGFALLSGGAVRYRYYSEWGISPVKISKIILFSGINFWLGLCILAGLTCFIFPENFAYTLSAPKYLSYLSGCGLLLPIIIYLYFCYKKRGVYTIKGTEFEMPSIKLAGSALFVACLDWIFATAVIYFLIPNSNLSPQANDKIFQYIENKQLIEFVHIFSAFMLSQIVAVLSHVPGGLGVFETVMLLNLSKGESKPELLGALILFRVFYYFIPFVCGLLTFLIVEIQSSAKLFTILRNRIRPIKSLLSIFVPPLLAGAVFVSGVVLIFSGSIPTPENRLFWINDIVPLSILELSHFANSIVGIALIVLSWGIRRRLIRAYYLSMFLIKTGIVISIIKGFDYEEAIILTIIAILLNFGKKFFRRRGGKLIIPSLSQVGALIGVISTSLWLGYFSYKNISYTDDLWWEFASGSEAPRFLRASVGAAIMVFILSLKTLIRPKHKKPNLPNIDEINEIHNISKFSDNIDSNLALLGDKYFMLNDNRDGFLMYQIVGRTWIAYGDPITKNEDDAQELIWSFREQVDQHDGVPVFYEVSAKNLPLYIDVGLEAFKLGEAAIVDLSNFSLQSSSSKSFRNTIKRLSSEQYTFEIIKRDTIDNHLPELREISDQWLKSKNQKEKGFSLGFFNENYLRFFDIAVIKKEDKICAFANIFHNPEFISDNATFAIDLMRHRNDMPNGLMDYLFINLFEWGKKSGYRYFNFGMAPLSGIDSRKLAPVWNKFGNLVYKHGDDLYNFEGLRNYKDKFNPNWEAKYLISPGGITLGSVLINLIYLISKKTKS